MKDWIGLFYKETGHATFIYVVVLSRVSALERVYGLTLRRVLTPDWLKLSIFGLLEIWLEAATCW